MMATKIQTPRLEDDARERISLLIERRIPWLFAGLLAGIAITVFSSQFEEVLSKNLHLAYFIPVIVYMASAVGMQTEEVYIRNLGREKVNFSVYLVKEFLLGLVVGALFGTLIAFFALLWFKSFSTALTVGFAMFASMSIAPAVSIVMPTILQKEHKDPALGAGPFTTAVQDFISLAIYFAISSIIILKT